ncbi:MAG TPA: SDR family oxidoreductase [Solirubrobacterales bacterium]|jgi:enoyl-[acyl-carrier protein] reductase III|nr:SDR family oxidoreductase [Solirubrobacterales bacterium]
MAICVTGGSSGLGRAIAERFARGGADVFVNYHANDEAAAEAVAAVEAAGGRAHLVKADVGTPEGVREVIDAVRAAGVEHLDQIVHCAAKAVNGPMVELDPEELRESIAVNGLALVDLAREAGPLLGEGSTIFYLSSRGARFVIPEYGALGTAKALGEHIVRYLAKELAPRGIRVITVAPGAVDTAALRAMFPDTYKDRLAASAAANPMGRGLELEDAAALCEALCNAELSMVTGQTITVDGGISL